MTDTPEIARISAALAAGPTPGPWFVCESINDDGTVDIETGRIAQSEWPPAQNCEFPTCHYIAACNPAAMTTVLAHIDAQAAEIERLNIALIAASEGTKDREYAEACFIRADKLLTADERTLHAEIDLLRADAGRLDFLEKHPDKVLAVGPRWYSRTGYRLPMCGRKDLRSAIDAAMKEKQ